MSENENQQSIAVNLCKNGCGFYGSTQFDDMCSVCHKESVKKRQRHDEEQIQKLPNSSPHPAAAALLCASASSMQQQTSTFTAQTPAEPTRAASDEVSVNLQAETVESAAGAAAVAATPVSTKPFVLIDGTSGSSSLAVGSSASTQDSSQSQTTPKRIRCGACKKKVGLTGFECRCGGIFCSTHRYSDKHSCCFDYQSHGQEQIRKANPQVVSSKIEKL